MIAGIFLRYIKTYQGINYIPITDNDQFCGLVGNNGIGKSSILEALECFFNEKPWNFNTTTKRSGLDVTKPQIVPIFLLKKSLFADKAFDIAQKLNATAWAITEDSVNPSLKKHVKRFIDHRESIKLKSNIDEYFLLPIGLDYKGHASVSLFNNRILVENFLPDADEARRNLEETELNDIFKPLLNNIKEIIEYIVVVNKNRTKN